MQDVEDFMRHVEDCVLDKPKHKNKYSCTNEITPLHTCYLVHILLTVNTTPVLVLITNHESSNLRGQVMLHKLVYTNSMTSDSQCINSWGVVHHGDLYHTLVV